MAIYMELRGIKGSVTDQGFENQVAVDRVDFTGITTSFNDIMGKSGDRVNERAKFGEIIILKPTDLSSIALMQRSFTFNAISKVTINYITTGKPNFTYMQIILKDVLISHFSHQHNSDDESLPIERLHFNYTHIECHYHPQSCTPANSNQVLRIGYDLRQTKEDLQ